MNGQPYYFWLRINRPSFQQGAVYFMNAAMTNKIVNTTIMIS